MATFLASVAVVFILTAFGSRDTETESLELDSELEGHAHRHQHQHHHHHAAHHKAVQSEIEKACQMDENELNSTSTKEVLQKVKECLKAREELQTETHKSLEKQKEQGKQYTGKLQKVLGVLNKLKGAGLRDPWKEDHQQVLTQLYALTGDIEGSANKLSLEEDETATAGEGTGESAKNSEQTEKAEQNATDEGNTSAEEAAKTEEGKKSEEAPKENATDPATTEATPEQTVTPAATGSGLLEQKQTEHGLISRLLDALSWH